MQTNAVSREYKIPFLYEVKRKDKDNPLSYDYITVKWVDYKGVLRGFFITLQLEEHKLAFAINECGLAVDAVHRDLNWLGYQIAKKKPRKRKGLR